MAVIASRIGTETRCFKKKAFRTTDGKTVYLVDHKSRFVRLNTVEIIDVRTAGSGGVTPTDDPTIEVDASAEDFTAEYSRVTGKLVIRKTVRAGTPGPWTLTGQELIIEKGDPATES